MGMMLGGVLFLAGCPGDLEEAQESAVGEVEDKGTLDECLEGCQQRVKPQEEECQEKLTEEQKVDKTSYDSDWLLCSNHAYGDLQACQVTCNADFR